MSQRPVEGLFDQLTHCRSITHGGMTPIDVVKTRIQVDPALARQSLISGGRYIIAKEGTSALLTGFGPTAVGYLVQVLSWFF